MNLLEKLQLIERVDGLISRKCTGSPSSLASRLSTSERNIYHLIGTMKEMGAPIYFCKTRNSYCYKEQVRFSFGFMANERAYQGGKCPNVMPLFALKESFSGELYFWWNAKKHQQ